MSLTFVPGSMSVDTDLTMLLNAEFRIQSEMLIRAENGRIEYSTSMAVRMWECA